MLTLKGLELVHSIERAISIHDPDSILEAAERMVVAVEDRMLTTREVAAITGLSVGTVNRWLPSRGPVEGAAL
jgi:DNA-directed RNA polymerase specialized sigma24 family protein